MVLYHWAVSNANVIYKLLRMSEAHLTKCEKKGIIYTDYEKITA